ncbi:MAG: hypothetical protein WC455_15555 [Dehalococcoidia bacterium]
MYTIANSFHNSECQTKYSPEQRYNAPQSAADAKERGQEAIYAAQRRAWRKLCGISGCTCGNAWGER